MNHRQRILSDIEYLSSLLVDLHERLDRLNSGEDYHNVDELIVMTKEDIRYIECLVSMGMTELNILQ